MIIFLLGVPGCGKSEFYRRLTAKLDSSGIFSEFPRVDDFPKLWDIFMEDERTGNWLRCRPTDDGGYKVTDDAVWDDILKEVNADVLQMKEKNTVNTLIFVEFSRPNYVHSIRENFLDELFKDSLAVYLDVPFEICWERNVRRHEKALKSGSDDHLVSREEMEETYGSDDKDDLDEKLPVDVVFIRADSRQEEDFSKLDEGVNRVYEYLVNRFEQGKNNE